MTLSDRVLRSGLVETRPVGQGAWTDPQSGITIRWSYEMPQGVQAIYTKGLLVGVFNIGEPIPNVAATDVTLHPVDYEFTKKCMMESTKKEDARDFRKTRGRFNNVPYNAESIALKRIKEHNRKQ